MEQEELKRKLMGLWEKTTHNSKDLLAALFDFYFDMRYIEYKEFDGKVVSAICGIPYYFGYGKNRLKGLYLISLSTEEGFRKKGILSELLANINFKAKEDFDFTFIVPHTELLADYYGTQSYHSSFFILDERYTCLHDFYNDYLLSLVDSDERIRQLKKSLLEEIHATEFNNSEGLFTKEDIIAFIEKIEREKTSAVNLSHTSKDLEYLLNKDSVRKFEIFIAYDSDQKITGIAFAEKEDLRKIKVEAIFVSDLCSYFVLLEHIKNKFEDYSLSVITSDPKLQSHSIIQQTYASVNPAGEDLDNTISNVEIPFNINKLLQPLGMVRLLRFDNIFRYIAESRSDADFKLVIRDLNNELLNKDENNGSHEIFTDEKLFIIKNGQFKIEFLGNHKTDKAILYLSKKEVTELLLRKNDSSNLIMEAFGIPRLNLQMRLLPC